MKEKVEVATGQGKAYFLIVSKLREKDNSLHQLVPGESVPAKMILVLTTEQKKHLVNQEQILIFHGEDKLDHLVHQVKILLLGKTAFKK
jgi:hypothetical protein